MEKLTTHNTRHKFSQIDFEASNPKLLNLSHFDITELIGTGMNTFFI